MRISQPQVRRSLRRAGTVATVMGIALLPAPTVASAAQKPGDVKVLRASFANNIEGVGPFHGSVRVTRPEGRPTRAALTLVFDAFPLGGTCADGVTPFTVKTTWAGTGPASLTFAKRSATATGKIRYTTSIIIDNCTGDDISDAVPIPDVLQPFTVTLKGGDDKGNDLVRGSGPISGLDALGDPFAQPLVAKGVFGEL